MNKNKYKYMYKLCINKIKMLTKLNKTNTNLK